MSSNPVMELGISGGAAASVLPLRQRDGAANEAVADPSFVDAEMPLGIAGAGPQASNVIELDTPQIRRAGIAERLAQPARSKINPRAVALALRVGETGAVVTAGAVAYLFQPAFHWAIDLTAVFSAAAVMAMFSRAASAEPRGLHEFLRRSVSRQLANALLRTLLPFAFSLLLIVALVPHDDHMRAVLTHWLTLWAMGAAVGVSAVRLGASAMIAAWREQGRFKQRIAIYGTGELAERLLRRLQASSPEAVELVGVFDDRARRRIASPGLRSLTIGSADDLIALSHHRDVDRVIVALPHAAEHRVVQITKKLHQMPVEICLAPDQAGFNLPMQESDELGGLPLIEVYGRPLSFGQILLKSAIDKTLAAGALVAGLPLLLAIAAAIKLDTRGPVFFRQNRHGFGDRVIKVFKFRTMTHESAEPNGESQSRPNDPRVTRVGRFLRCWSLDELPQLLNVLHGEMSLVGPRPHAISMKVEERPNRDIVPDYALRHHVKPGITGWAQVNGYHGPVATEEALRARIRYDLDYINNWSLWFDFQIVLRTLKTVLGQRHAY